MILLCLMPDDFTRKGRAPALNGLIRQSSLWLLVNPFYYFTLTPDNSTNKGESTSAEWVKNQISLRIHFSDNQFTRCHGNYVLPYL
jgi:hypothetical protein